MFLNHCTYILHVCEYHLEAVSMLRSCALDSYGGPIVSLQILFLVPEKSYWLLWNVMLWASNRVIELLCSKLQGALNSNLASPALKVGMVLVMVRTTKPWKNSEVETLTESP